MEDSTMMTIYLLLSNGMITHYYIHSLLHMLTHAGSSDSNLSHRRYVVMKTMNWTMVQTTLIC